MVTTYKKKGLYMSTLKTPVKPLALAIALAGQQAYASCDGVYTVNSLTDEGGLSFTEAHSLINTNCNDGKISETTTLKIADSLAGETISITNQIVLNTMNLEIEGPSSRDVTLAINNTEAAVRIVESGHLSLKNLILDGNEGVGTTHAIELESGKLDLDNVLVQGFYSQGDGAIISRGTTTVKNSEFNNNRSANPGSAISAYTGSTLTIENTVFDNNVTTNSGGGAISTDINTDVEITDSTFKNNSSQVGDGGAINGFDSAISIRDSVFDTNSSSSSGGAIYLTSESETGTLLVSNSIFKSNTATRNGGAIYTAHNNQVEIDESSFELNSSNFDGGALSISDSFTMSHTTLKNNTAQISGGALYTSHSAGLETSQVNISDSTFEENQVSNGESGNGGAIYIGNSESGLFDINIDRSLLNNNTALDNGGAIYMSDTSSNKGVLNVSNSTISNNSAGIGGSVTLYGGYSSASINHSTFVNNTTTSGASAVYGFNVNATSNIVLDHTIISGNTGGRGQLCSDNASSTSSITLSNSFISEETSHNDCLAIVTDPSSQIGTAESPLDPMLNDLTNNGGPTQSFMPKTDSPVINAGDSNIENAPSIDQRGRSRIQEGTIDIGAVETEAPAVDDKDDDGFLGLGSMQYSWLALLSLFGLRRKK